MQLGIICTIANCAADGLRESTVSDVELYIGSPIEHASDRAVLGRAIDLLSRRNLPAVILANVNVGGRQIDLIVALDQLTYVIEAKSSSNPVRGGIDGIWEVRVASGGWKPIRNYYQQTLQASYALRDAMSHFAGTPVEYHSAALIFVPSIPAGSLICPGDFKVAVIG